MKTKFVCKECGPNNTCELVADTENNTEPKRCPWTAGGDRAKFLKQDCEVDGDIVEASVYECIGCKTPCRIIVGSGSPLPKACPLLNGKDTKIKIAYSKKELVAAKYESTTFKQEMSAADVYVKQLFAKKSIKAVAEELCSVIQQTTENATDFQKECLRILPFVIAGAEGREVCCYDNNGGVDLCTECGIATDEGMYFIVGEETKQKPTPSYRPYRTIEEAEAVLGKKIVANDCSTRMIVTEIDLANGDVLINHARAYMIFKNYSREDGSPVGIEEDEA
jgi:hypothetical protein